MEHKDLLESKGLIKSNLVEDITILFYEVSNVTLQGRGIKPPLSSITYEYYPLCKAVINNKLWEIKSQLSPNNQVNENDLKYFVGMLNLIIKGEIDNIKKPKKNKVNKI